MGDPKSIFVRAKVRNILFDGLIVDCNVQDFAGTSICQEIEERLETINNIKVIDTKIYSISIFGAVRHKITIKFIFLKLF